MKIVLDKSIISLSNIFVSAGYTLYLVGGMVRNIALGIPGGDVDVCSTALPHDAADFLRKAGLTVIEKAVPLGTIEVHLMLDGKRHVFEHTTFRKDYYPKSGEHRPYKVEFTQNIGDDARRRDFTINALYLNIGTKQMIDPTGSGLTDIKNKVIRAAADNPDETIRDDGLRIMRMARFAAELSFDVCPDLMACANKRISVLADISAERKRDELKKILMADTKYTLDWAKQYPHLEGLKLLRCIGALKFILPMLSKGDGIAQSKKYHTHDVLGHGLHACAAAAPIFPLRLAALLHDIGKPKAMEKSGNMYNHEIIGEGLARQEMSTLKLDNKSKAIVLLLIRHHMFDLEGKAKPKTIRKRAVLLGKDNFEMLIALRRADFLGSGMNQDMIVSADHWQQELDRMAAQHVPWGISDLAVTGSDIIDTLQVKPSVLIGDVLNALLRECVAHPAMNQKPLLLKRATELILKR